MSYLKSVLTQWGAHHSQSLRIPMFHKICSSWGTQADNTTRHQHVTTFYLAHHPAIAPISEDCRLLVKASFYTYVQWAHFTDKEPQNQNFPKVIQSIQNKADYKLRVGFWSFNCELLGAEVRWLGQGRGDKVSASFPLVAGLFMAQPEYQPQTMRLNSN